MSFFQVRGTTLFTRFRRARCHSLDRKAITREMSSTLSTISIDLPLDFNLELSLQFGMISATPQRDRNLPLGDSLTIPQRFHTGATALDLLGGGPALKILDSVIEIAVLLVMEVAGTNRSAIHFLFGSRLASKSICESFIDILGFHSIHN